MCFETLIVDTSHWTQPLLVRCFSITLQDHQKRDTLKGASELFDIGSYDHKPILLK